MVNTALDESLESEVNLKHHQDANKQQYNSCIHITSQLFYVFQNQQQVK